MTRLKALVLTALTALYALYFVHLAADRPGIMRWFDTSVYTDEGWYGAAAVHRIRDGSWYIPQSFNPSYLVPGWPALLRVWFALTGPGMVSARILALLLLGVSLYCMWRLVDRAAGWVAASLAVALLLLNPYTYSFSRLALLEPLVIACTTLALWIALRSTITTNTQAILRGIAVGALLAYAIAGKTTAVAFAPSLLIALYGVSFRREEHAWWHHASPRRLLAPATAILTAAALWVAYFALVIRPQPERLESFRAVYRINAQHISLSRLPHSLVTGAWFARCFGPALLLFALLTLVASLVRLRRLWQQPLFVAVALNFAGTLFLFAYRAWLIPRYYQLCLVPTVILVALGLHQLLRDTRIPVLRWAAITAVAVAAVWMGVDTARYALHPSYTFRDAAIAIAHTVHADHSVPPVILAASGEDLALWTELATWNPSWPLHGMDRLLDTAHAGWYAVYVPQGPLTYPDMDRRYNRIEVARYSVMPNSLQQQLVLFKLIPRQ